MRRLSLALIAATVAAATPQISAAQVPGEIPGQSQTQELQQQQQAAGARRGRLAQQVNAGPCPFVKILYDAARYVEMPFDQPSAASVGFTGEIEGVTANCRYREDDPITINMNILFNLGRGPQAQGDQRTYRYWIAVTDRNTAVLAKEYFDLPVNFRGQERVSVEDEIRNLVIPRATMTTSGANFEVLIGFEVTSEMAEFNRTGSRFRINAGTAQTQQ